MTHPTNASAEKVLLHDGSQVDAEFYERIRHHVTGQLRIGDLGQTRTLRQICSKNFWLNLSNGERRLAGLCVMNMVKKAELPLASAGKDSSHSQRYCRK